MNISSGKRGDRVLTGYNIEAMVDFAEAYIKCGVDKETAYQAVATIARGIWKRDHPDTSNFPDHLKPGNVKKSLDAERGKRLASNDTAVE
ncbi:MAG: hypothetical protein WAP58_00735 [Peptococcia bacterium]